jgi:hypothetical protein
MRGNVVIVTSNPRGKFDEGYVKAGQTHYPGMIVEKDPTVAVKNGRHTFRIYAPGTDGEQPLGAYYVVRENPLGDMTTPFAAGEWAFYYAPYPAEELNLLIANLAGTADDHALGEKLMVDTGTGKLIATTGTPESEVAELLEAITDPTADTLAWCEWGGK